MRPKAVLTATVPAEDVVNVSVDGAKKYYVSALACLCLNVSKKLDTPLPRLLGEIGVVCMRIELGRLESAMFERRDSHE